MTAIERGSPECPLCGETMELGEGEYFCPNYNIDAPETSCNSWLSFEIGQKQIRDRRKKDEAKLTAWMKMVGGQPR